jgi:hypothetical protein
VQSRGGGRGGGGLRGRGRRSREGNDCGG